MICQVKFIEDFFHRVVALMMLAVPYPTGKVFFNFLKSLSGIDSSLDRGESVASDSAQPLGYSRDKGIPFAGISFHFALVGWKERKPFAFLWFVVTKAILKGLTTILNEYKKGDDLG